MKLQPVKNSKKPNYPTIELYIKNPELLSKNVPENWLKNTYVATSLATFVLLGTPKDKLLATNVNTEIVNQINPDKREYINEIIKDSLKIAPIFAHGDGSGATGCVVMSPPVFISEEEAKSIIFNALEKEGFKFDTIGTPVIKFKARPIANSCFDFTDSTDENLAEIEIYIDGYNKENNLIVQFVSIEDFMKFQSTSNCQSSVQGFNTKIAAKIIREQLISKGKTNAVVFYDPISSLDFDRYDNWEISEKEAIEEAKKQLLAQVEEFIKWIKKENINFK